jgi:broad specificity phosphatase PhoE
MPINLYLLRHGETEASISGQYVGSGSDISLTANGMQMAEKFADAYKDKNWKAIYSSPLLRTRQTVAPLQAKVNCPVSFRDGLKEIDYGKWELKSADEIKATDPESMKNFHENGDVFSPPGGETVTVVRDRVLSVLGEVKKEHSDGDILFVSHRTTLRVLLCALLGVELKRYRKSFEYLVCSLSMLELRDEGALLVFHGDRSYLEK